MIEISDENSFIKRLRQESAEYRTRKNMTQEALGEALGVTRAAVSSFERGGTLLSEDALDRLIFLLKNDWALIAGKLRVLADTVDSPIISEDVKQSELQGFINTIMAMEDARRNAGK